MMTRMKLLIFLVALIVLLPGCGHPDVKPVESMFELSIHMPKSTKANQTVDIEVDIINKSNYKWTGIHGLDLFKYTVKDNDGREVSTFEGIRAINALGIRLNIEKKGTYSFYKSESYQENLNQITIKNPGVYTLEVSSNFSIEYQGKDYPLTIQSKPLEILIK